MIGGTTPKHTFKVPVDTGRIKTIKLVYIQLDEEVLTKRTEDFTLGEGQISVKLTQEETFLFDYGVTATIQLRIVTLDGDVLSIKPRPLDLTEYYDNEVLV